MHLTEYDAILKTRWLPRSCHGWIFKARYCCDWEIIGTLRQHLYQTHAHKTDLYVSRRNRKASKEKHIDKDRLRWGLKVKADFVLFHFSPKEDTFCITCKIKLQFKN